MHWINLMLAIVLEVLGTTSMKLSKGFSNIKASILLYVFYFLSFAFLTMALKKINLSVAYAIWSGVGMLLITIIGVRYFNESINIVKLISIGLIILGVVGLNFSEYI